MITRIILVSFFISVSAPVAASKNLKYSNGSYSVPERNFNHIEVSAVDEIKKFRRLNDHLEINLIHNSPEASKCVGHYVEAIFHARNKKTGYEFYVHRSLTDLTSASIPRYEFNYLEFKSLDSAIKSYKEHFSFHRCSE